MYENGVAAGDDEMANRFTKTTEVGQRLISGIVVKQSRRTDEELLEIACDNSPDESKKNKDKETMKTLDTVKLLTD